MKAVVINQYGGSDQLVIRDIPDPEPQQGEVLIKIRAFGINRAETYMRRGLWGEVAKVSG
ncbi:MAG TPA: alcohol dehydrogenase, partial [Gammaproteobacteria bacterium]|nr:alcohol dehydrogenase [Gammaproteobacteria bacterium]